MRRITVTIDDGGSHQSVNDAASLCMRAGVLHRFSILPNGACADSACELAMGGGIQISAHLDCVEGPFILSGSSFPRSAAAWALSASRLAARAREEWSAQVERLLSMGAMVTCLDSHRHLHHLPHLRDVFLDIAGEYRIGTARAAVLPDRDLRFPQGLMLHRLGVGFRRMALKNGIGCASWMLGFGASGGVGRAYLETYLPKTGEEEVEMVLHPATKAVWSRSQPGELDMMLSDWFAGCVA